MIDDGDVWKAERLRRFLLALNYHGAVDALTGLDPRTWLERHAAATTEMDTATAYALIHREVAPISNELWRQHRGQRTFATARRLTGIRCQAVQVWGYDCPINAPSAELEMDHAWPFSLGGQSVPSNGVWLCQLHNRAKSHDIHNFDWPDFWPSWLLLMLNSIRIDCERALRR